MISSIKYLTFVISTVTAFGMSSCGKPSRSVADKFQNDASYSFGEIGVTRHFFDNATCVYRRTIADGSLTIFKGKSTSVPNGLRAVPASFVLDYVDSMNRVWGGFKNAIEIQPDEEYYVINENGNNTTFNIFVSKQSRKVFIIRSELN